MLEFQTWFNNKFNLIFINKVGYWRDWKKEIEIVRSYAREKDQVLNKLNRNLNVTTKLVN